MTASRQQVLVTLTTNPQSTTPLSGNATFPVAYTGTAWTGIVFGIGGTGSYGYALVSKPAWITATVIGNVWSLSGSPGASGAVVVDISDGATTQRYSTYINVRSAISGGSGEVVSVQPAYTGQPYSFDPALVLNNPTLPLSSVVVSGGTLPIGMSVSSNIITATNVTGTTQDVTLTVTDGASKVAVLPVRFAVKSALSVSTYAPSAIVGQAYKGKITVSGGSGKYSIREASSNPLPSGLEVNAISGELDGQPTVLSSAAAIAATHFVVTDLVSGEQITTTLGAGSAAIPVNSGIPLSANFGNGVDGDIIINGSNSYSFCTLSGGVNTLQRDVCLRNVTITGSGKLAFAGYVLRWTDTFDLSAASTGAICSATVADGSWGMAPGLLGAGSTTNGSNGIAAAAPTYWCGGKGAQGGNGGHGNSTNVGGASPVPTDAIDVVPQTIFDPFVVCRSPNFVTAPVRGGGGGSGGGGGGGSGTNPGGDGGSPGPGGDVARMVGKTLKTSGSTPAGVIDVGGFDGADGSTVTGLGNKGGGGGGAPGGGGFLMLAYAEREGPTVTAGINADGGDGGDGGLHSNSSPATDGNGAAGAEGGNIVLIDLMRGVTSITKGAAGSFNSGRIGGLGGQCRADL